MIVTTYNQHVRLLSSEPFGCLAPPKSTRAWEPTLFGSRHCYGIITLIDRAALGNTVGVVAKFYSHEWAKVRQGRTDAAIKAAW